MKFILFISQIVQSNKPQKWQDLEILKAKLNLVSFDAYIPPKKHIQNPRSESLGNFFYEAFCGGHLIINHSMSNNFYLAINSIGNQFHSLNT